MNDYSRIKNINLPGSYYRYLHLTHSYNNDAKDDDDDLQFPHTFSHGAHLQRLQFSTDNVPAPNSLTRCNASTATKQFLISFHKSFATLCLVLFFCWFALIGFITTTSSCSSSNIIATQPTVAVSDTSAHRSSSSKKMTTITQQHCDYHTNDVDDDDDDNTATWQTNNYPTARPDRWPGVAAAATLHSPANNITSAGITSCCKTDR